MTVSSESVLSVIATEQRGPASLSGHRRGMSGLWGSMRPCVGDSAAGIERQHPAVGHERQNGRDQSGQRMERAKERERRPKALLATPTVDKSVISIVGTGKGE